MPGTNSFFSAIMENLKVTPDARVTDWNLMGDAWKVSIISLVYVIACKYIGPLIMKNREPFALKNVIIGYNILQIICCVLLTNIILKEDLFVIDELVCDGELFRPIEVLEVAHWALYLKMLELIETVFFIMRKKQSQVTNLHLYHHATTFLFVWLGIKYGAGLAMGSFVLLNSIVHIVMYGYYLVAALGNKQIQELINPFKKYLTIMQMIQFTIIVYTTVKYMVTGCTDSWVLGIAFAPNVVLVFYLFYDFYKKSYNKKLKKSH